MKKLFCILIIFFTVSLTYASTDVVISEVMHGVAGSSSKEFVELYNPTDNDIDLQNDYGLKLKFVNSSNNITNKTITWLNSTIPAHGYFLFASSAYKDIGDSDAIFSYGLTSNAGVIITLSGGAYIDRVGWGSGANSAVEDSPVESFSTGQSIERKPGSIAGSDTDTDNNYNDFIIRTDPEPRHSGSNKTPYYFVISCPDTVEEQTHFVMNITCYELTGAAAIDYTGTALFITDTGNITPDETENFSAGEYSSNFYLDQSGYIKIKITDSKYSEVSGTKIVYVEPGTPDTGELKIEKTNFISLSETTNIILSDANLNIDTTTAETVTVIVTSLADTTGIIVILKEISANTEVFTAAANNKTLGIQLCSSSQAEQKIMVRAAGDTITAKYNDINPSVEITKTIRYKGLQIKINEVVYNPEGTDQGNEWIELYNAGDEDIDITGWKLTDKNASQIMTMPALIFPSKMYIVWHVDADGVNDTDFSDSTAHIYSDTSTTVSLTNTQDQIALYISQLTGSAGIVDFIAYSTTGSIDTGYKFIDAVESEIWQDNAFIDCSSSGLNLAEGNSLILLPDGADSNLTSDWQKDVTPTKGFSNEAIISPSAPQNLIVSPGYEIVWLNWDASRQGDYEIAGYNIYRSQISGQYDGPPLNSELLANTDYTDTDVVNDTTYYYIVTVEDTGNNESDNSNEVSSTPTSELADAGVVIINEIMYDPEGAEPDLEWIELCNTSDSAANISNCIITDGEGTFTIPDSTIISSRGYFVLGYSINSANENVDIVYGDSMSGVISLANTDDDVIFKNAAEDTVDYVHYYDSWRGPDSQWDTVLNKTIGRKYPVGSSNDYTNWARSAYSGGTPGQENDCDTIGADITHTPVDTSYVNKDIGIHADVEDNIEKSLTIGSVVLFYRAYGSSTYDSSPMSRITDTKFDGIIPASYVNTNGVEYYIRVIDGSNNITYHGYSDTPHYVNVTEGGYTIVINEIMYDPPGNEPDSEWFEIYNYGDSDIDITGWSVTDGEDEYKIVDTTIIQAHSYLVFGYTSTSAETVDIVYGDTAPQLQLTNIIAEVSDNIAIKDINGITVDEVNYSAQWGAENAQGPYTLTLERILPTVSSNDASNWAVSQKFGGTPGIRNCYHYIRNVYSDTTEFYPQLGENTKINYEIIKSGTVTILGYNRYETYLGIIKNREYQDTGTHTYTWDGKINSEYCTDIIKYVVELITDANETDYFKYDYTPLRDFNDWIINDTGFINQFYYYYLPKPAFITVEIEDADYDHLRYLCLNKPQGKGSKKEIWDWLSDTGVFFAGGLHKFVLDPEEIIGNVLVIKNKLEIEKIELKRNCINSKAGEKIGLNLRFANSGWVSINIKDVFNKKIVRKFLTTEYLNEGDTYIEIDSVDDSSNILKNGKYNLEIIITNNQDTAIKRINFEVRNPVVAASINSYKVLDISVPYGDNLIVRDNETIIFNDNVPSGYAQNIPLTSGYKNHKVQIELNSFAYDTIYIETHYFTHNKFDITQVNPSSINPSLGETVSITIELEISDTICITVEDSASQPVKYVDFAEYKPSGESIIIWDGTDPEDKPLSAGDYTLILHSMNDNIIYTNETKSTASLIITE